MRSGYRRFVGIDLGGGRGKNTAVARVELTRTAEGAVRLGVAEAKTRYGQRGTGHGSDEPGGDAFFRDDVLVEYLERWVDEHTVVGVNAPLTLPPCIRCTLPCPTVERCEVPVVAWMRRWAPRLLPRGRSGRGKPAITPYTQRATEVMLAAVGIQPRETLGQGTGPLAARAAYLRRHMSPRLRLHENMVEVHPRATIAGLLGRDLERRTRTGETDAVWGARKQVLTRLGEGLAFDYVWPELVVRNAHVFNAVLCAFTAFLWAFRSWRGPTDLVDPATGADDERPALGEAAADLGHLWVEDGWIWTPPPT